MADQTHKPRTYRGYTIFHCAQTNVGKCDGKGWHIQTHHHAGQPNDEEQCPHASTLDEAQKAIVELGARERFTAENAAPTYR